MLIARPINANGTADVELIVFDVDPFTVGIAVKHLKGAILADFGPVFAGVRNNPAVEQRVLGASGSGSFLEGPVSKLVASRLDLWVLALPDSPVNGVFGQPAKLTHGVLHHVPSQRSPGSGPDSVAGAGDKEPGSLVRRAAASGNFENEKRKLFCL